MARTFSWFDRAAAPALARRRLPGWAREPLLHFLLLGAALFALDHWLVERADDPRLIVVGAEVDDEARRVFVAARGREPDAAELQALRRTWVDNEVLYREGLAMQVDRGDSAIRERVIFKALSVVDANVKAPPADDAALRAWFEARRAQYDEPTRYDFQEAVLPGDAGEAAVRAFVETLNKGQPGDTGAGLRVFKGRPQANLVDGYGEDFARVLDTAPPGEWRAYQTRGGWRAMRLDAVQPGRPARFEALRGVVLQDWTDQRMAEARSAALRALAGKYRVRIDAEAR
jgi:hypothetical protein